MFPAGRWPLGQKNAQCRPKMRTRCYEIMDAPAGGLVLRCQKPGILTLRACRAWAGRTKHRAQTFADLSQTCMMSMPSPGLSCPGPIAGRPTHGHPASSVCLCVCAGCGTRYCARRQGIIVRGSTCCGPHRVTNHHCLLNRMYSVESVQTHV